MRSARKKPSKLDLKKIVGFQERKAAEKAAEISAEIRKFENQKDFPAKKFHRYAYTHNGKKLIRCPRDWRLSA